MCSSTVFQGDRLIKRHTGRPALPTLSARPTGRRSMPAQRVPQFLTTSCLDGGGDQIVFMGGKLLFRARHTPASTRSEWLRMSAMHPTVVHPGDARIRRWTVEWPVVGARFAVANARPRSELQLSPGEDGYPTVGCRSQNRGPRGSLFAGFMVNDFPVRADVGEGPAKQWRSARPG